MPQFKLPDPGEGLVEATIIQWKVAVGDTVKINDIVVEVETAKSLVELPIPWAGEVTAILAQEGDEVEVGTPIVVIDNGDGAGRDGAGRDGADSGADVDAAAPTGAEAQAAGADLVPEAPAKPEREAVLVGYGAIETATSRRRRRGTEAAAEEADQVGAPRRAKAAPPVRKYARDKGVDLTAVTPSREDGVVTRSDVDAFLQSGAAAAPAAPRQQPTAQPTDRPTPAPVAAAPATGATAYQRPVLDRSGPREERIDIKGVTKMMAQAMVASKFSAPHVTEFITVDVTRTMELVERLRKDRDLRELRINPLLILARAMTIAVRRNPGINAAWDEEAQQIVRRNYVNLGIAAATPRGLIVPNIKDADLMDLRQLAEAMADLVATAKSGRTQPADQSGGTITITNVGVFGVDTGTPIINPGESAIVAFGAVRRMPWVVGEGAEERIEPRWVTQLAVAFDHRLVDGELGSRFLADLAALMEDPARALVWA
ncbi:dihydrolipoamide acetyltransferase family protein [Ornithinimicrobium avium]|uniref:Dihydrolipoamide acetyltransferase component of pyruvate dehydrogenase complex n=1 Tax=Ornithinimicrobium avium TaxID=2283195 RepID=A0A345NMS2_9MICO|nr:dihydrolipoamide acetyltransferase family protein [Ornithinimicrobium avium]AXH96330.1 2-oxo acid dehydrogenase subunit E2 [Ornithinimicrobium avium]